MNFRRTLRTTILAGALALGFGSAAHAGGEINPNRLPVSCSIPDREIRRTENLPGDISRTYTTWLNGNDHANLVVARTNDPLVHTGAPYRVPLAPDDMIEFVAEDRKSIYRPSNVLRDAELARKKVTGELDYVPQYESGVSSLSKGTPLYTTAQDFMLDGRDFPQGVDEATVQYWTKTKCFDHRRNEDREASVRFPVTVYKIPERTVAPPETTGKKMDVSIVNGNGVPERQVLWKNAPECSDTIDNDNDGAVDYPNDPGCRSPRDNKEKSWRDVRARDIEQLPVHRELNVLIGGGVDQYTASDSRGTTYAPLDFDTKSIAARYRVLGEKTKIDLQGAITQGDDNAGHSLRALNAELHADYKLFRSNISPGISAALGVKDVRTYTDYWGEDSRQGNGYGFLGLNLTATGNGGFASENFAVLRAGAVAQPIIDKKLSFNGYGYDSTTDMELAFPEFSLDARKKLGEHLFVDAQIRGSPKTETLYTSSNTNRELTKTSQYLNFTLGLGYRGQNLGAYLQGKWAHNDETWDGLTGANGQPYTLKTNHEGAVIRGGITWTFDK